MGSSVIFLWTGFCFHWLCWTVSSHTHVLNWSKSNLLLSQDRIHWPHGQRLREVLLINVSHVNPIYFVVLTSETIFFTDVQVRLECQGDVAGNVATSQLQDFDPDLGLLSGWSFACAPSVHVGFLWFLQFPLWTGYTILLLGMNECLNVCAQDEDSQLQYINIVRFQNPLHCSCLIWMGNICYGDTMTLPSSPWHEQLSVQGEKCFGAGTESTLFSDTLSVTWWKGKEPFQVWKKRM